MPWRYQPVFEEQDGERSYYLCEVYFDDNGRFERWSDIGPCPGGEDLEGLTGDLTRMLVDTYAWKAVRYSELQPGMAFEPRIDMEARANLADYIDEVKESFKRQPSPATN